MREDERQRLIHLHTADLDKKPVGELYYGEIAIEHSGPKSAKLYIETDDTSVSGDTVATFITEDAIKDYVEEEIEKASIYNERYKGVIDALPSADDETVKIGDEYIVGTPFNIPANRAGDGKAKKAEKGDYILARTGGLNSTWDVRERNLEGAVVSTGMTANQIVIAETSESIKSVAPSTVKVGSADTASDIDNAPVFDVDANEKDIKLTVGTKTSAAFTVPFATSATSSVSAVTSVSAQTSVNALSAQTAVNAVSAQTSVNAVSASTSVNAVSSVSATTSNSAVTSTSAQTSVNAVSASTSVNAVSAQTSVNAVSATTANSAVSSVSAVTSVSASTISLSGVQDADDLKAIEALVGTSGVLTKTAANTWALGSYLSADTTYVKSVEQTIDASGNTVTTFTMSDSSQETITQALVIDCGEY